ncbi:hypothetical protein DM860_008017 [Cuscuta australis]|uniref:DUF676 domain-containing protein n=1 Tax=Cuscuta australis TaxID=267555 RepID=A0A328E1L9_9ASTE|nr:hypothetical protein DM860_008017 [Cuscuta australis]
MEAWRPAQPRGVSRPRARLPGGRRGWPRYPTTWSEATRLLGLNAGFNNIWKNQSLKAYAMNVSQGVDPSPSCIIKARDEPDHLIVLVHGIMGSPSEWTYIQAELKKRLGSNFLIYGNEANWEEEVDVALMRRGSCHWYAVPPAMGATYLGIWIAVPSRLGSPYHRDWERRTIAIWIAVPVAIGSQATCDWIIQLVQERKRLRKISFLSHSLGGLIARHAISALHTPSSSNAKCGPARGLIAGLEPIHFITLATPHLGVRGNKQLPFLLGVSALERLAVPMAPVFVGRTGSQLFLTDGKPNKLPLLLKMASDCEDGQFLSALGAFRCRTIYANVSYDHMVGWRTSSIRREAELVKPPLQSLDDVYKHVVAVEYCPPVLSDGPHFPPEAAKAKEAAQHEPNTKNALEYHEIVEEEMIRGLQQLGWKKVDVNFHSATWPFFAHNNIHVKNEWLHNAGAGVVAHIADDIRQVDSLWRMQS